MADLSVILTTADPADIRMRNLVASWAGSGLLRDSVWVTLEDITDEGAGPPRVTATVITANGVETADLFRVVGVRRLSMLRLVVAHLLPQGREADAALVAQGAHLARLFRSVLPYAIAESDTVGTEFCRINLLVPASGTAGLPSWILQPDWDINAMVSAEDRPDVDRASIWVRDGGNFDGHAAAAICSVAGLWAGIENGCLDMEQTDSTKSDQDMVVLRPSVRAVVGEDLTRKLADAAIMAVQQDPAGAARLLPWARAAAEPLEVARQVTAALVKSGDWAPGFQRPEVDPRQRELGTREAMRDALRFNLRLFGVAGTWLVRAGRRAVENAATGLIVGRGGDYVVRLEPRTPAQIVQLASARLDAQSDQLQRHILVEEASSVVWPVPSTWSDLRQTCFALADGSKPGPGVRIPEMAGVRVLLPAGAIVPDPEDVFQGGKGPEVRACDPAGANRRRAKLQQAISVARAEEFAAGRHRTKLLGTIPGEKTTAANSDEAAARRLSRLRQAISEAKAANTETISEGEAVRQAMSAPSDVDQETKSDTEHPVLGESATSAADAAKDGTKARAGEPVPAEPTMSASANVDEDTKGEIETAEPGLSATGTMTEEPELAAELERELVRLDQWVNLRAGSVLWELAQDVDARSRSSAEHAKSALETATTGGPPPIEAVRRAQRTLIGCWVFLSLAFVGIVGLSVWLYLKELTSVSTLATSIGLSLVLAVVLASLANHRFYRAVRGYEWSVQNLLVLRRRTTEEYVAANREANRLDLLSRCLLDWSETIGWVLHHPWRLTPVTPRTLTDEALGSLPAAVAVAVPTQGNADLPMRYAVAAAEVLCSPGWSGRQFDQVVDLHEEITGTARRGGYLAADIDTLESPGSPRRLLLEFIAGREAQTAITESARTAISEAVIAGTVELPPRLVTRMGSYGDGRDVVDTDFFGATLGTAIPFVDDIWTPTGMQLCRHLPATSMAWIPRRETVVAAAGISVIDGTGDIALRVDLSSTCVPADISDFAMLPEHIPAPDQTPDGKEVIFN